MKLHGMAKKTYRKKKLRSSTIETAGGHQRIDIAVATMRSQRNWDLTPSNRVYYGVTLLIRGTESISKAFILSRKCWTLSTTIWTQLT